MTTIEDAAFADAMPEAMRRLEGRDPDDAKLLALSLRQYGPQWAAQTEPAHYARNHLTYPGERLVVTIRV